MVIERAENMQNEQGNEQIGHQTMYQARRPTCQVHRCEGEIPDEQHGAEIAQHQHSDSTDSQDKERHIEGTMDSFRQYMLKRYRVARGLRLAIEREPPDQAQKRQDPSQKSNHDVSAVQAEAQALGCCLHDKTQRDEQQDQHCAHPVQGSGDSSIAFRCAFDRHG
jgi:hypothetical protein